MAKLTNGDTHQGDGALQEVYLKAMGDLESVFTNAVGQMLMNTAQTQQQIQVVAQAATTQNVTLILHGGGDQAPLDATKGGVS